MKQYVKPRIRGIDVDLESIILSHSMTVGFDDAPSMGYDGEGDYGRCLNDYINFT